MDQASKGAFMANYLNDSLSDPSETDYYNNGNYTHTKKDRYWLRGKIDQNIHDWTTRLDLDIVSDRDYLTEFTSGITGFTMSHNRFLEIFGRGFQNKTADQRLNNLCILRSWKNMSLRGELLGINDVRIINSNPTPLWKLPSLNFTGLLPVSGTLINFGWDADYVNYWRENGVGAHRFDLFPRLSMPLPLGDYIEATVDAGIRDTAYLIQKYGDSNWNGSNSENRFLVDLSTEIGTTLARDFNVNMDSVYVWSHTVRPYVRYHYIPNVNQDDLPRFDNVDTIGDQNLVTYGIDNFFEIFGRKNNREYSRQYGYFKIRQGYDLRSHESATPLTPVNVEMGCLPLRNFRLVYKTNIDVYGDGVTYTNFEGSYSDSRGDILSANYLDRKLENRSSIRANARINLLYHLAVKYRLERSIEDSKTVEESIALVYQQPCWSVELSSNYTPGNQKIMLTFNLANIGNPLGIDMPGL